MFLNLNLGTFGRARAPCRPPGLVSPYWAGLAQFGPFRVSPSPPINREEMQTLDRDDFDELLALADVTTLGQPWGRPHVFSLLKLDPPSSMAWSNLGAPPPP